MRILLAVLCIGAVTFLLRVLVALVKEGTNLPPRVLKFYMAKFTPSGRRGDLVVMNCARRGREFSMGNDQRMAL